MEGGGAAGNRDKRGDGGEEDSDNEDIGKGQSPPATNDPTRASEDSMADLQHESSDEMVLAELAMITGLEDESEAVESITSISSAKSYKESQEEITDSSPETGSDVISSAGMTALFPRQTTETPSKSTGPKAHPSILGSVRREHPAISYLSGGALYPIAADTHQEHLEVSVAVQTEASWLYEHAFRESVTTPKKKRKFPRENDIYTVLSQDLSSLDILCDTEFKENFLKLFQESLRTLSSVGPPTILAYKPETSREDVYIEVEKDFQSTCEFCGNPLKHYPSFESLEEIAKRAYLFCCQECRELHEFIVSMKKQYAKPEYQRIDISPNQERGSESERRLARERALQRLKERQMAKQLALLANEQDKGIAPVHGLEPFTAISGNQKYYGKDVHVFDNKLLKTISFTLSQESAWTRRPIQYSAKRESQDVSYSISYCDFTLAGGKLVKNQFLQQYYKNGVKFLTMFPNGSAQIFYPSGNLAIMLIPKKENAPSICIVQEDKSENAEIQAVFDSSGRGTCYHPNGNVWINITIRGGHYSDQDGSKVKAWIWPNNLQKKSPRALFKPIFLALNLNVGVRILMQDKLAISFLAMGKQAKISIGTKIELLPGHHPWPKYVSEDDLLLFASRIKILRIFAKLHGCLDFPTNDWGPKVQLPSYILKWAARLTNLCKDCEISTALDNLIAEIINSPA